MAFGECKSILLNNEKKINEKNKNKENGRKIIKVKN